MVKTLNPSAHVTGTDIAQSAIDALHVWERIFEVKLDGAVARKSYKTKLPDSSIDLVFAFRSVYDLGRY